VLKVELYLLGGRVDINSKTIDTILPHPSS